MLKISHFKFDRMYLSSPQGVVNIVSLPHVRNPPQQRRVSVA
jgi:hypothetical protein